jgi:hypothetical protein
MSPILSRLPIISLALNPDNEMDYLFARHQKDFGRANFFLCKAI